MKSFRETLVLLGRDIHQVALDHGWQKKLDDGLALALMHSEISEALEWCRKDPAAPSDHIPEFTGLEEEMADLMIRILDFCEARKLRIGDALLAKHEFNKNRPYKHGGKKF